VNTWRLVFWIGVIPTGFVGLYALHRLGLWMEERGYIYYVHKKPSSGAAGCFVAFQQAIEPRVEHVLKVDHVNHRFGDEGVSGQDSGKRSIQHP
jgi:hypothetical protein